MKVTLIAATKFGLENLPVGLEDSEFGRYHALTEGSSADRLAHFAGRACYAAWGMERESTSTDQGYLANILAQGHHSVLEHASASFYLEDVSRSLLAELTRHRHLNFSVISQRFVDYSKTKPVYPPSAGVAETLCIDEAYRNALEAYEASYDRYVAKGFKRKQAREAARALLPNCAPVSMVVTGNHRAFRDMLQKRHSVHADLEIQMLVARLLSLLKALAPAIYQDISDVPSS